jgi:hypothetical protein
LRSTRESSGVGDASLDDVVGSSRDAGDGVIVIPEANRIRQLLFEDVNLMLEPLRAAAAQDPAQASRYDTYRLRLDRHGTTASPWPGNQLEPRSIDALTSAGDDAHDTLHRLVMDLHRELNRLLGEVAIETVDGARASGLTPADRSLVAAFMKGLNQTAPLKFDHPGLGATAARYGGRLSIQNDLGTTDGHIVVLHIDGLTATAVYSDVHRRRVSFLKALVHRYAIDWHEGSAAERDELQLIVGAYTAADLPALHHFLTFFGSRLVFLIDWNRARKRLARLTRKSDAVAVLQWAADNDVGHRGFLQCGGLDLIGTVFERVAAGRIRYGTRLDDLVGRSAAAAFLQAVLRITSVGVAARQSERLIQDEIEAELLTYLDTAGSTLLDTAAEHAMLMSALADRVRATLGRAAGAGCHEEIARTARLAKTWEDRADVLVQHGSLVDQPHGADMLAPLLARADKMADALEEAAFLLTLLPDSDGHTRIAALRGLADLVGDGTKEYVRCVEYARAVCRTQTRADIQNVLLCADRIAAVEHAANAAERAAKTTLVGACTDFRELQVLFDVARRLEEAADALAGCALTIRDYVLASKAGRR